MALGKCRRRLSERSFAVAPATGEAAPIPGVRRAAIELVRSTESGHRFTRQTEPTVLGCAAEHRFGCSSRASVRGYFVGGAAREDAV